jgi:predicted dehydrogenase
MSRRTNRRQFLMQSAAVGAGALGLATAGRRTYGFPANEKLRIAIVGVGGMGGSHVRDGTVKGEQVVALCDIDDRNLYTAAQVHPMAEKFNDFRVMFDQMSNGIDAVICATPDHNHAVVTAAALRLGKHAYTQKPLTHTVYEAHVLSELARSNPRLATQMGNQGHSHEGARKVVELVRAGAIGKVQEVHSWTDRPIWPQSIDRPSDTPPVPHHVHWDVWLGPMAERPYNPAYHPFKWRGWWDFGTGALGDMACHIADTAFWALDLRHPTAMEAQSEGNRPETGPKSSIIAFDFPARGDLPPVKFTWYDGGKFPPKELVDKYAITHRKLKQGVRRERGRRPGPEDYETVPGFEDNGSLLIGEKGAVLLDTYGERYQLLPKQDFEGFKPPPPTLSRSPNQNHMLDWITAAKNGTQSCSNFEYASALTGMVLLGNLAIRTGKRIEWDAANMRATNASECDEIIRPAYRKGWSL